MPLCWETLVRLPAGCVNAAIILISRMEFPHVMNAESYIGKLMKILNIKYLDDELVMQQAPGRA